MIRKLTGFFLAGLVSAGAAAAPITRYVVVGGAGAKNGTSWADAYASVKTAYEEVGANADGGEVWVAAGVYGKKQNDKKYIIALKSNVTVRGGFAGGETSAAEADPENNVTIFTADIVGPYDDWRMDATTGPSSGVMVRSGNTINMPPADQFPQVRGWVSASKDGYHCSAFGISSGQVTNCVFRGIAFVSFMQSAIRLSGTATTREEVSSLTVDDCLFVACGAMAVSGGNNAIATENADVTVTNSRFVGCGGGVSSTSTPETTCIVRDCTFEWCAKAYLSGSAGCVHVTGAVAAYLSGLRCDRCFFENSYGMRTATCIQLNDSLTSFVPVISNCVFTCCYSSNTNSYKASGQSYGLVYVSRKCRTEIVGCDFVGNTNITYTSNQYGLSTCLTTGGSSLFVRDCSFRENALSCPVANMSSGLVYSENASGALPVFVNCSFVRNVAWSAGTDTGSRIGRMIACGTSCSQAIVNCIFLDNDCHIGDVRVPEMANGDQTWGFFNTIMWHSAADYLPFPGTYVQNSFVVVNCALWNSPLTMTTPSGPPAISHRNTRCVDRAGKYFLEYAG